MRTVFKYYKSYIPLIVGILAFLFGQAMCELALPGYMSDIINNGIVKGDMDYIWKIGMIMILVSCGSVVCSIVSSYLSARTAAGSARRIRGALFDKVTDFSAAELSEFSTASLITRSTNDVQMVQQTTVMTLRLACFAPIMGIGAVIKALRTSVSLSWTVGVALAVIVVIMLMSFFLQTDATNLNAMHHKKPNAKLETFGVFDNGWHTLAFEFAGNNSIQVTPVLDEKRGTPFTLVKSPASGAADKLQLTGISKAATYTLLIDSVKVEVNNADIAA